MPERTEYRVVGERRAGEMGGAACGSLAHAESRAMRMLQGSDPVAPWKNVRIQTRTVTETPWVDLPDQGGEGS